MLEVNKNSIVFRLARHLYSSTPLVYWRASEASETVLGVDNAKSGICYYRASEASEILLGVDNAKSGIICYIYMYVCMDGTYAL